MGVEGLLRLLRGRKAEFHLVGGSTSLLDPSGYPFEAEEIPILCDFEQGGTPGIEAHTSGFRSIVMPGAGGLWFKAKAIGIPSGGSKPICSHGRIYTYHLSEAYIGTGRLIWGFSTVDEARNEIDRMVEARELGCPAPRPVGIGFYGGVHVLDFRDREELFKTLASTPRVDLLGRFRGSGRPVEAACVFMAQPTDVRVDEVLYGFLHPLIGEVLDPRDCVGFLRWMGSSCGLNLRKHHDSGLLHGTIPRGGGFMTNSHTANHLVDEVGTYTTDYHMAYRSDDRGLRRVEAFFLASLMNPLPGAAHAAEGAFGRHRPLIYDIPFEDSSQFPFGQLGGRPPRPKVPGEEFTEAFLDGVSEGYNRRRVRSVGTELRREALLKAAACKKELFRLLGLPEWMERGVDQVARRLAGKRFSEGELRDSIARVEAEAV